VTKIVLGVEDGCSPTTEADRKELTQKKLLGAFSDQGQKDGFSDYRPEFHGFYFDENAAAKKRKAKKAPAAQDYNGDDLIGIAEPPPGLDIATAKPGIFDNPQMAVRDIVFASKTEKEKEKK
jgi:hypothetical protein